MIPLESAKLTSICRHDFEPVKSIVCCQHLLWLPFSFSNCAPMTSNLSGQNWQDLEGVVEEKEPIPFDVVKEGKVLAKEILLPSVIRKSLI